MWQFGFYHQFVWFQIFELHFPTDPVETKPFIKTILVSYEERKEKFAVRLYLKVYSSIDRIQSVNCHLSLLPSECNSLRNNVVEIMFYQFFLATCALGCIDAKRE